MIKAVAFDVDDTLLDHQIAQRDALTLLYRSNSQVSERLALWEFIAMWHEERVRFTDMFFAGEITLEEQRIRRVQSVYAKLGESLDEEQALHIYKGYLTDYERYWNLYDDVVPCLDALSDFALGIISNGDGEQQRRKLHNTGLLPGFSCVVVSSEVGAAKPEPAIFEKCAQEFGLEPAEIAFVGSNLNRDAAAACEFGMKGIWLDRRSLGLAPTNITTITDLSELPDAIKQLVWA